VARFGRRRIDPTAPPTFDPDFLIESYLDHQVRDMPLQVLITSVANSISTRAG